MKRALAPLFLVVVVTGCTTPVNSSSEDAFFRAIDEGDVGAVQELLDGAPSLLHETDGYGFTPLMRAVSSMERTLPLVKSLIDAGAAVNAQTDEGYTALHMMIDVNSSTGSGSGPEQIARLLVDAGADVEVRQHWGWTPLMCAAVEGTPEELQAIVNVGGDVDASFPNDTLPDFLAGRTALMATIGEPAKTQIMIDAGADLLATDAHGQTALEYARQCLAEAAEDDTDMEEIIDSFGEESVAETLQLMEEAGIDPDAPMDDTGTTCRQSLEASLQESFAAAEDFDYAAEVRASIDLLESAVKNTR